MDDDVSDEYRTTIERIFYLYIIPIICVVGVFGNIAILVVLAGRRTKETAFVYIRALAVVDLTISLVVLGISYVRGTKKNMTLTQHYYGTLYEGFIYLPTANAAQMANLFITIAMAVHRVASVIKIHGGSDMYSIRINVSKSRLLAKRIVVMILIFSAAINSIRFSFYNMEAVACTANTTDYRPQDISANLLTAENPAVLNHSTAVIQLGKEEASSWAYHTTGNLKFENCAVEERSRIVDPATQIFKYDLSRTDVYFVIIQQFMIALSTLHFCELATLTTVNIILIGILRRSKSQRKNLIPSEDQQRKKADDVTRMLVVTVIVHIVCHLHSPFSADPIAKYVFGSDYVKGNQYKIQLVINNALTLSSHVVTFFLYLVSAKFRGQVKRTWRCVLHRLHIPPQLSFSGDSATKYSWTPSYGKGGASPILAARRQSTIRFV